MSVGLVSQWSRANLGLEVMEPCRSRPGGVGLGLEVVEPCRSSMIRPRPWKPRTICIEIHFDWVFAEAHQLEDLFMEPWVEATCGGGGEILVCSSRSGFFFFLILQFWNFGIWLCLVVEKWILWWFLLGLWWLTIDSRWWLRWVLVALGWFTVVVVVAAVGGKDLDYRCWLYG